MHSKPKKRAFLITYFDRDLEEETLARKERYEREGYEVKTIFLPHKCYSYQNEKNKKLEEQISWLKASEQGLLTLDHHGSDPTTAEIPKHYNGTNTALMLAQHGLNAADLRKLRIRYGPCFGGQTEVYNFCQSLHENGAGHFIADAKLYENATLVDDQRAYTHQEFTEN